MRSICSVVSAKSDQDPQEGYLHICQGGTEVLVNISFKYSVEMLELDVSNQRNNKYLPKIQKETDVESSTTSNSLTIRD